MAAPENPGRTSPSAAEGAPYLHDWLLGPADDGPVGARASGDLSGFHDSRCTSRAIHRVSQGSVSAAWASSACMRNSSSTSSCHCLRLAVASLALSSSYHIPCHRMLLPWPPVISLV